MIFASIISALTSVGLTTLAEHLSIVQRNNSLDIKDKVDEAVKILQNNIDKISKMSSDKINAVVNAINSENLFTNSDLVNNIRRKENKVNQRKVQNYQDLQTDINSLSNKVANMKIDYSNVNTYETQPYFNRIDRESAEISSEINKIEEKLK